MRKALGPVWLPLESISGKQNMAHQTGKCHLAYDGRNVWVWTRSRVQIVSPTGLLMSPFMRA